MIKIHFVEEIQTRLLCSIRFSPLENSACYEIMWTNIVEQDMPQMEIWPVPIACWILKATNTFSEYVMLTGFSLQHWLHKIA